MLKDMKTFLKIYFLFNVFSVYGQCSLTFNSFTPYCTDCTGSISAIPTGIPPYKFQWSTGQTSSTIVKLCPGVYSLTLTDALHCVTTKSISLKNWVSVNINTIQPTCISCCDGSATITASSGVPPYYYINSCNTQTSYIVTGLCYGVCQGQVGDSQSCGTSFNIVIEFPLSIEQTKLNNLITVFPNPFSSTTKFFFDTNEINFNLSIVNVFGEVIQTISNIHERVLEFNQNQLASGIYSIIISKDEKIISIKKIIILD